VVDEVGGKDGAELVGVPKSSPGGQAEDGLVNTIAGDEDPVSDLTCGLIAPDMTRDRRQRDGAPRLERRPRRRVVSHSASPVTWTRWATGPSVEASSNRCGVKVLSIGVA